MALLYSDPFPIGTKAPDFRLLNTVNDNRPALSELKGKIGTIIMFICNHCPYVLHINEELIRLANDYRSKGINCIAISSNSIISHLQDGPEFMKNQAKSLGYPFPYLFDETQEVAKAYYATCTPDFYLFDEELKCVYHGRLDDSSPGNGIPTTGKDMRNALEGLLNNERSMVDQKPSMGCGIKWN